MKIKSMQIKKKLALLLSSALLVTSINVMPVEATNSNQASGAEGQNAVARTNLPLEITSAPATGQTHDAEWKNLNTEVTPDSNSGTYQITESGKYYLSANIEQTNNYVAVQITNGANATICLDGYTISSTRNIAIKVESGASLTIEDCSEPGSKTGTGSVTGNGQDVIRTYGNLVVNRVNVTNTGTGNAKYAINAGGSSYDVGSVVIKNSKLKANSGSLYAICVENITIESTECTGEFYVSKNNNMTISSSTVNEGNETAIYYTNGQGGIITIADSVLTTTSSAEYDAGLMCWCSNGPITINIEGSTINAPENGIRVNHGEKVKISNSKFICTNTDTPEWGYAISYEDVDVDSGNKLEVSDVEIKDWNTGIRICSDESSNPEMDLTLSGDVKFEKKAPLNTDIDFPTSGEGKVNLHFNDLTTRNMVINAYSGKMENVICDNDYSTYFIDSKYMFDSEQDGEKYVLNCTPRSITRQPTEENPQIAVNDAANVSYQWYSVESYENAVTNETIVECDECLGTYEDGLWKPQQFNPNNPAVPYAYYLAVNLNAGDLVILENPDGTLESMKDILFCSYSEGITEKEYRDDKLYFTIPSDGVYLIAADFMSAAENWPINANTRLKIAVKGTSLTGEVAGSTKANLVTPKAGTFCCKATWAKGSAFEYSVLSDAVTVTQPIAPSKYTVTVIGGTSESTEYAAGDTVTITANTAPEGKEFDKWEVTSGGVTLADASKSITTFTMPESAVIVQATYKDVSGGTPPEAHTHTILTDAAVAPTCTTTGLTEGSHCSVCGEVITAQTTVPALGHDWSNDWVIIKVATTLVEGKKECTCKREGCNQKKYEVVPVIGTPADPNEGKLDKDAEVAPNASIEEATLDNTKTELLNAPAIFTAEERQAIENGANARVWMEVSKTDESSITSADKTKISDAATSIMGDNPSITYFDADLFKQVGDGAATQLHEPGIDIEVTIKVPENLRNADSNFEREYKIIRLHTDVATGASLVDILSGTFDKITGEFTFKTDKFSTYAIAYTDKKLVTGVTLTPETATLTQAGQTVQLTATVAPADATDKSVTWTSSNTNVATVDANGKVTAVANGTAVITVTTTDGNKTAQSTITVAIATTQTPSDNTTPNNNTTPSSSASTKKAVSNRIRLNGGMKFSQTGKQLNLAWGKVSGADGYDVYVQYCGKLFNAKSVTTIKNAKTNKIVIKKINGKSIDPKKVYKAYVVAYKMSNGKKVTLAKSITVHVVGSKHATETNVKSIKLSKDSYTLKKGKTVQIKAKSVLVDSKKKRISDNHGKEFRYTTSNVKVATVTKDGKIKAVGKGTCTIYVYAVNGYAKKITVTVK